VAAVATAAVSIAIGRSLATSKFEFAIKEGIMTRKEKRKVVLWSIGAAVGLMLLPWAASLTHAAPVSDFSAIPPTQYEDGNIIPATDILAYRIYCSNTQGGPYLFSFDTPTIAVGTSIDVATCVLGVPGVYYFVATAISGTFGTESGNSNETTRTYTAADLGKTPLAPTLFTVQ